MGHSWLVGFRGQQRARRVAGPGCEDHPGGVFSENIVRDRVHEIWFVVENFVRLLPGLAMDRPCAPVAQFR